MGYYPVNPDLIRARTKISVTGIRAVMLLAGKSNPPVKLPTMFPHYASGDPTQSDVSIVRPKSDCPLSGADRFLSPQPDTSLHCNYYIE